MIDVTTRLRNAAYVMFRSGYRSLDIAKEAATTIEALRSGRDAEKAENAKLRAVLQEMVYEATHLSPEGDDGEHHCRISRKVLESARAALSTKETTE